MTIIIIILIVIWGYSYFRFRQKQKYFSVMVAYLQNELQHGAGNEWNIMLRLSSALIEIQHYRDAFDIYQHVLQEPKAVGVKQQIALNMEFCKKPIPCSNGPKNLNHSYWHKFLLVRLGRQRYNFLTKEDFLMTNSILRNMK